MCNSYTVHCVTFTHSPPPPYIETNYSKENRIVKKTISTILYYLVDFRIRGLYIGEGPKLHSSHRRNVMDVTGLTKNLAVEAMKAVLAEVESIKDIPAETEKLEAAVQKFALLARGHATASPFIACFRSIIAEYARSAPRRVFAALLIEALTEHFPDMPRPTSRVPQAILATELQGYAVEDLHGRGYGSVVQIKSAMKKVLD